MPRIPYIDPARLTPEQQQVYGRIVSGPRGRVQGPLLVALHRPELAEKWQQFGEMLRFHTVFPPLLSEIAILVTAQRWRCELEWHLHEGFALKAGVPPSVIGDILAGRRPDEMTPEMGEIFDYTAQLHDTRHVSPQVYQAVLERWGVVGSVELTALVGYYTLVAMTLNAHEFSLPEGVKPVFNP